MVRPKKLRFAVLVDSDILKRWQVDTIANLLKANDSELIAFIKNTSPSSSKASNISLGFRAIYRGIDGKGALSLINWKDRFKNTTSLEFLPNQKGISNYLNVSDIETLKSLNLDFVLRFGFGILKGEALTVPTYGIWSFHHGNPSQYRGGPAGLWEIIEKNPVTGSMLQQLNEKLDQGHIIREGFFQTINHSYKSNLYHILNESVNWPSLAVKSILHHPEQKLNTSPILTKGKLYKIPSNWKSATLLWSLFSNKLSFHLNRLFNAEKWNVGTVDQSIEDLVSSDLKKVNWLNEAPKNQYFADPFSWKEDEILLELFDYRTDQGSLKKLDKKSGKLTDFNISNSHCSYPFVIENKGRKYILPENYRNKRLRLFEVDENLEIVNEYELLKGPWIDSSMIHFEKKWWIFCTHQSSPKENLFVFHSIEITGPYKAHTQNPVLTDIRSARMGGTPFIADGKIIRPTQNCAKTYGGSIVLKEVEKLSETEYQERLVKEIMPTNGRFNKGLHTLSKSGNKILVDGKRFHFNFFNFIHQLKASNKK